MDRFTHLSGSLKMREAFKLPPIVEFISQIEAMARKYSHITRQVSVWADLGQYILSWDSGEDIGYVSIKHRIQIRRKYGRVRYTWRDILRYNPHNDKYRMIDVVSLLAEKDEILILMDEYLQQAVAELQVHKEYLESLSEVF